MRKALRVLLALVVFVVAPMVVWRPGLWIQRETYVLLERIGAIDRSQGLWGQILGHNIPRHSPATRWAVVALGAAAMFPVLVACLLFVRGRARPAERTRRLPLAIVVAAACTLYALTIATVSSSPVPDFLQEQAFELGKRLGCTYFQSGAVLIGPEGPFMGGDWAPLCNRVWRWGPRVATECIGFAMALVPLSVFGGWTRRSVHACPVCGYSLSGLTGTSCPECGLALPGQSP